MLRGEGLRARRWFRKGRLVLLWLLFAGLWARVLTLTSVREAGAALLVLLAVIAAQVVLILAWIHHNRRRRTRSGERRRRARAVSGAFAQDVLGRPVQLAPDSEWFDRELQVSIEGGRKVYRAAKSERIC